MAPCSGCGALAMGCGVELWLRAHVTSDARSAWSLVRSLATFLPASVSASAPASALIVAGSIIAPAEQAGANAPADHRVARVCARGCAPARGTVRVKCCCAAACCCVRAGARGAHSRQRMRDSGELHYVDGVELVARLLERVHEPRDDRNDHAGARRIALALLRLEDGLDVLGRGRDRLGPDGLLALRFRRASRARPSRSPAPLPSASSWRQRASVASPPSSWTAWPAPCRPAAGGPSAAGGPRSAPAGLSATR